MDRASTDTAGQVVVTVDLASAESMNAFVDQLDHVARTRLIERLRSSEIAGAFEELMVLIQTALTHLVPHRDAVGVVFRAAQWHGDYYLDDIGTVLFADGSVDELKSGGHVEDLLASEYGKVGPGFAVSVDLRTEKFSTDFDYPGTIHDRFGVPAPTQAGA